jgi:hypothetical protein
MLASCRSPASYRRNHSARGSRLEIQFRFTLLYRFVDENSSSVFARELTGSFEIERQQSCENRVLFDPGRVRVIPAIGGPDGAVEERTD